MIQNNPCVHELMVRPNLGHCISAKTIPYLKSFATTKPTNRQSNTTYAEVTSPHSDDISLKHYTNKMDIMPWKESDGLELRL
jgi:hypothetical protein